MPAGVEGFVPARLRIAREARGMRQNELAERIGYGAPAISKWENASNPQSPEPAAVALLARELGMSPSWFMRPILDGPHSATFFRSMISELEMMRAKARARLEFVEVIEDVVSEYVDLPDVDIPDFMEDTDFRNLRVSDIEYMANQLREHWNLGDEPIDDLMLLLENAGVVVAHDILGSPKLDGLSRWSESKERPFMLLGQDKNVGVRRRLDAGHELGHIMLHRRVSQTDLKENFRQIEDQAMIFAGAFLLPEAYSDSLISLSLDGMLAAKKEWKVSVGAQIKRLANMELISEESERRLWQYYSYRKWRFHEPLDNEIPVEQPQNLKDSIELILSDDAVSPRDLIRDMGMSANDIEVLTGIEAQKFDLRSDNVFRLKVKKRGDASDDEPRQSNIIPFGGK